MISYENDIFRLDTAATSYWMQVTKYGHLLHLHYGQRLPADQSPAALIHKRTALLGSSVIYMPSNNLPPDNTYCLDNLCLEWSGIGKGDYRHTPAEILMPDGTYTADFIYQSHRIMNGCVPISTLPSAYCLENMKCQTLEITLLDESNQVKLFMYYTVFYDTDVISRRVVLENQNPASLSIRKLMSMSLDLADDNFSLVTFDGGWIKEGHRHERRLSPGIHVNSSTTGESSNRHNPGFLLAAANSSEQQGNVYGFNLIYSGNHYSAVELSGHDLVRIQTGINPYCFEWKLTAGERFETPEAFMSFSDRGYNGLSHNFHNFINHHIVRGDWQGKERPILINSWEAYFFRFTQAKLLRLAKRAKRVGIELFVLDDGWFGKRNDDKAGLGDYTVNKKKFHRGLAYFARRIVKMGLSFGLWFEPEMVNEDSDLFRNHPEYALRTPNKTAALGRNQLVLDLTNSAVRDYIVKNVTDILDTMPISYIKWDFNRHLSDACSPQMNAENGRFFHMYVLGLYDILNRIFVPRPQILLETCSSGGNRFDAGMLCYSPQIWTSDNTDPIERLMIQGGLSYLYPPATMGAHVSEAPHQQTLRATPLSTRFNVAAFGCLGYEMDFKYLSRVERKEISEQIAFYKLHRRLLQYGDFYRGEKTKDNKVVWNIVDKNQKKAICGLFQTLTHASEGFDRLRIIGLKPKNKYRLTTKPQSLFIRRFGGLVKHILPFTVNPEGWFLRTIGKYFCLSDCVEEYSAYGSVLAEGVLLNNQFVGSHYNEKTRLLGDFGSSLYLAEGE